MCVFIIQRLGVTANGNEKTPIDLLMWFIWADVAE